MELKKLATRALYATLMTGGLTLLGCGVANAAETGGDDGIVSGSQAGVSIDLPVDLSGNGISVLGDSSSSGSETVAAAPAPAPAEAPVTSGDQGVGSGTQALIDVSVPVTVGGNAISVAGDSGSADASTEAAPAAPAAPTEEAPAAPETSGDDSVLGGTQGLVDVSLPVTVGGNAVSVLGDSSSEGATNDGGAETGTSSPDDASTTGEDGVLSGSQIDGDVSAPITAGGNAISVLGDSSSEGAANEIAGGTGSTGSDGATTGGDDSVLGGTQGAIGLDVPVTVGGNAISVLGDSSSEGAANEIAGGTGSTGSDGATTGGDDSVLGGTQIGGDAAAPVTVGGNAISVIGDSSSDGAETGVITGGSGAGSADGSSTSGDDGILGGTQVLPEIGLPVTVGGNAVSVVGDSESTDAGTVVVPGSGGGDAVTGGDDGILGGTQLIPGVDLPITVGGNAISVVGDSETDGPTTVVIPGGPTDPGTPTDPTDPTDPGTPTDPTDPTDPGTDPTDPALPGDGGEVSNGTGSATAAVGSMTVIAAGVSSGGMLASTGADTAALGIVGGLVFLGGLLLLGFRRFKTARN
jgi:hypothetical protein